LFQPVGQRKSVGDTLEFSLGHNVRTKEEVDAVLAQAKTAGAKIVKQVRSYCRRTDGRRLHAG
jgi:hypothetical protein